MGETALSPTATDYGDRPLYDPIPVPSVADKQLHWWQAVTVSGKIRRVEAKDAKEAKRLAERGGFRIKSVSLEGR